MRTRSVAGLTLLSTIIGMPLFAAGRADRHVKLVVHQYDNEVEYIYSGDPKSRRDPLVSTMKFELPPNATVHFSVADHNPLLFTYSIEGGTDTDNANYAEAAKYVAALQGVVTFLKPFVPEQQRGPELSPEGRVLLAVGFDSAVVTRFVENVTELETKTKAVAGLIEQTGKNRAEAEKAKATVEGWNVENLDRRIAADLAVFAKARDALRAFHGGKLTPSQLPPQQQPQQRPQPTNPLNSGGAVIGPGNPPGQSNPGSDPPVPTPIDNGNGDASGSSSRDPLYNAYQDLRIETDTVARQMAALNAFAAAMKNVLTTKSDFPAPTVSFQKDRHPILTIGHVKENEPAAKKSTLSTGKFQFDLVHETPVKYHVGPAVLYSWVEKQDWGTEATPAGKFKIVRKDSGNEVNGVTLAAMLGLTPSRYAESGFSPSLQIGFSPVKDRFGAFLGLSFKVYDLFTLGGGVAYEQTERLDDQVEGQELNAANDLKISRRPQTGVYFSVTVPLAGSKK